MQRLTQGSLTPEQATVELERRHQQHTIPETERALRVVVIVSGIVILLCVAAIVGLVVRIHHG